MVTMSVMAQSEHSLWTLPYTSFCSYFSHCGSRGCVHCSEYSPSSRADQSIQRPVIVFPKLLTASKAKACRAQTQGKYGPVALPTNSTHTHTQKNIHDNILTHMDRRGGVGGKQEIKLCPVCYIHSIYMWFFVCMCLIQWLVVAFWSGGLACVTPVSGCINVIHVFIHCV